LILEEDKEKRKNFYKYKGIENNKIDFVYPYDNIDYTISVGDTIMPSCLKTLTTQ